LLRQKQKRKWTKQPKTIESVKSEPKGGDVFANGKELDQRKNETQIEKNGYRQKKKVSLRERRWGSPPVKLWRKTPRCWVVKGSRGTKKLDTRREKT